MAFSRSQVTIDKLTAVNFSEAMPPFPRTRLLRPKPRQELQRLGHEPLHSGISVGFVLSGADRE
jgi:hypothetical protein